MGDVKITVRNDGSLLVSGPVVLEDMAGQPFGLSGRTTFALCRCGHSENKPFCDGSHRSAGFKSEVAARVLPPPAPKP